MAELERRKSNEPATMPEQEQTVRHKASWVDGFKAGMPPSELSSGVGTAMNTQVLAFLEESMGEHDELYRDLSK